MFHLVQSTRSFHIFLYELKKIEVCLMVSKMNELHDAGILLFPEELGISARYISPSMLVPKSTPGKYCLVTDFTGLNKHIRRFGSVSPTIKEAKSELSKF